MDECIVLRFWAHENGERGWTLTATEGENENMIVQSGRKFVTFIIIVLHCITDFDT